MNKEDILKILEGAKDKNGDVPMRLVRQAFEKLPEPCTGTISRQTAIDAVDSETVSTNPEHFKSSEKFIKFMDDADIASFGKWQWANGFNTAVVAAKIQLKKLPSAQPEYTELTPEEAASEIASGSTMPVSYWLDDMIQLKQMGYAICKKTL